MEEKRTAAKRESEIRAQKSKSPSEGRLRSHPSGDSARPFTGKNLNPRNKIEEEKSGANISLNKVKAAKSISPSRKVQQPPPSRSKPLFSRNGTNATQEEKKKPKATVKAKEVTHLGNWSRQTAKVTTNVSPKNVGAAQHPRPYTSKQNASPRIKIEESKAAPRKPFIANSLSPRAKHTTGMMFGRI